MSRFRTPLPTSPDDPRLLEVATSLDQQLDISKLNLKDVRWMEWVPAGRSARPVPSDWCFFLRHSMVMPAHMMGKLTVEEWRPLIASSLTYEKKLVRSLRGKAFLLTVLPLILVLAGMFAASILLQMSWIIFLYIVLIIPVGALGGRRYSSNMKQARLEADTQASAVTGKDPFLNVLKKIEIMGLNDVNRLKSGRRGRRVAGLPSIPERIENLQGFPSTTTFPTS